MLMLLFPLLLSSALTLGHAPAAVKGLSGPSSKLARLRCTYLLSSSSRPASHAPDLSSLALYTASCLQFVEQSKKFVQRVFQTQYKMMQEMKAAKQAYLKAKSA
jgi:hypothetical protein